MSLFTATHSGARRFGKSILAAAFVMVMAAACGDRGAGGFAPASPVQDHDGSSLGSIAFTTSCDTEANAAMRRGLALLHHMTYTEAESEFARAGELDPGCALSYWGRALTYVHPLWPDVPSDEAFERGTALLEEARRVGSPDERDVAYIAALEAYYRDGVNRSERERLERYAEAWAAVADTYPTDSEAALFEALSQIAIASDADKTHAVRARGGELAERVLAAIPDHPGAHHYVIHAYDVPPLADRALAAARTYGSVAPENAHALHMTSHIFTRVGDWEESIAFNERSAAAALQHPVNGQVSHHYLHALDYLAYARLQRGDVAGAMDVVDGLNGLDGPVMNTAVSAYAFAAVPARIALEQAQWDRAAAVPVRTPATISWDAFPHLEAISQFARALGAARSGDLEAADRAVARLGELRRAAGELPGAYDWGAQVAIQELGARAWLAYARGNAGEALALMTEAAELEGTTEKNPVTPGEVLPARELLGDMLMAMERYAEALQAYRTALDRSPNRFNSVFGAGRAAELAGDDATAREYFGDLLEMVSEAAASPRIAHAREVASST